MVFLKIEMEDHYIWFIPSYHNLYFLKFLNDSMLEIHQYLLCSTSNKAKNKEFMVFRNILNLQNIYDHHKKLILTIYAS